MQRIIYKGNISDKDNYSICLDIYFTNCIAPDAYIPNQCSFFDS